MITFGKCPRCRGSIIDYGPSVVDDPKCITCGWRRVVISAGVLNEVEAHLGEDSLGNGGPPRVIANGKPPLSGWERVKRRKETESVA